MYAESFMYYLDCCNVWIRMYIHFRVCTYNKKICSFTQWMHLQQMICSRVMMCIHEIRRCNLPITYPLWWEIHNHQMKTTIGRPTTLSKPEHGSPDVTTPNTSNTNYSQWLIEKSVYIWPNWPNRPNVTMRWYDWLVVVFSHTCTMLCVIPLQRFISVISLICTDQTHVLLLVLTRQGFVCDPWW